MTTHQSRTDVWPHEEFEREIGSKLKSEVRHDPAAANLPPYYPDTACKTGTWVTLGVARGATLPVGIGSHDYMQWRLQRDAAIRLEPGTVGYLDVDTNRDFEFWIHARPDRWSTGPAAP